ncbi:hypothetical protein LR48_Vigan07g018300 [Vigna angularis]|uniref:Uncharacterized protein n=1 Tax=Phaseolus angularis TaxID=3914 RepID=A0A0L9UVD0_PHAAN|nr:hypothetical protein LR48_Vigan07g018300 [Vigna angularis]
MGETKDEACEEELINYKEEKDKAPRAKLLLRLYSEPKHKMPAIRISTLTETDAFSRNSVWCLRLSLVVDGGRKVFMPQLSREPRHDRRLSSSSRPLLVVTTAKCFGRFLYNVWSAPLLPSLSPVLLSSGFAAASASICRGYLHFLSRQACCHAPRYLRVLKVSPSSFEPLDLGADQRRVEGLNHWTPVRIEERGLNHWTPVRIGGE